MAGPWFGYNLKSFPSHAASFYFFLFVSSLFGSSPLVEIVTTISLTQHLVKD
jgi:hypothetical protein